MRPAIAAKDDARGPVSRVLSRNRYLATSAAGAAIHLGYGLLRSSSSQPGSLGAKHSCLSARDPYLALLRVGFAMRALLPEPRCALAAPFHPCLCPLGAIGGILSVALSLISGPKALTRRALPATLASWSPDFPRPSNPLILSLSKDAAARPPGGAYLALPRSRSRSSWNRIARTSPSISPLMRSGRQRRWKASTALCPSVIS